MANAIKKIQRAVTIDPSDAENWIVWALIMRHVGNYQSAKYKLDQALKLEPMNKTALSEM